MYSQRTRLGLDAESSEVINRMGQSPLCVTLLVRQNGYKLLSAK